MLYSYETELSGDVKQQIFPPVRNRNCIAYHAFVFTFLNSFGDLKGVWCPRFLSQKKNPNFWLRVFIPKTFYKVWSLTSRIGWFINLKSRTIGIALMTFKKSLKFVCKHLNINLNIVHKLVVWWALTWNKECQIRAKYYVSSSNSLRKLSIFSKLTPVPAWISHGSIR